MFNEDLSAFLDPADFGTTAVWSVGPKNVNGIFDKEYVEVFGAESSGPAFRCASTDVPTIAHGQTLVIDGTTYTVVNAQPNHGGPGMTLIRLRT